MFVDKIKTWYETTKIINFDAFLQGNFCQPDVLRKWVVSHEFEFERSSDYSLSTQMTSQKFTKLFEKHVCSSLIWSIK